MFLKSSLCVCKVHRLYNKTHHLKYFLSVHRKNSQNVNSLLSKLDDDIKNVRNINVPSVVEHLEVIDPNWPHAVDGQNILASVIHRLHQNGCHSDVNLLVNILLQQKFAISGGLCTTILKSYFEQRLWTQALPWFEEMKLRGQLKHTRIYNELIGSLAQDNLLQLAYHYFKEVEEEELHTTASRIKSLDHQTLLQLLQCALREKSVSTFIDCSGDHMKMLYVKTNTIVDKVINYIENWAEPVPMNLVNVIGALLKLENKYDVNFTSESKLKCMYCNTGLKGNPVFSDVCENMVSYIRDHMLKKGLRKDLDYLDRLLDKVEYFDLLIDAGNVLHQGSKENKIFTPERLNHLLVNLKHFPHIINQIALVFPQSFHKQNKIRNLNFINEFRRENIFNFTVHNIALRRTHDDLVLCYLAAKSELVLQRKGRKPTLVSSDSFLDYRFIAGKQQHSFFNWLHHRRSSVDLQGNIDNNEVLQPVVRDENDNLHLISKDGIICCCVKKKGN